MRTIAPPLAIGATAAVKASRSASIASVRGVAVLAVNALTPFRKPAGKGKEEAVKAIGAEAVITRGEGDLKSAVDRATGGEPVDVVADLVAGPLFKDLINVLRPEGRNVTAGAIGGPVVELDLRTVYLKHLQLHGSSQGTRSAFRRLVRYIEEGKIRPRLWRTYPLSRIREAQQEFMSKQFVGKFVMQPDSKWQPIG